MVDYTEPIPKREIPAERLTVIRQNMAAKAYNIARQEKTARKQQFAQFVYTRMEESREAMR